MCNWCAVVGINKLIYAKQLHGIYIILNTVNFYRLACYFSSYVRKTHKCFSKYRGQSSFHLSRAWFLLFIKILFLNEMELAGSAFRTTIKDLIPMSFTCAV
jgi:hypothetical protein